MSDKVFIRVIIIVVIHSYLGPYIQSSVKKSGHYIKTNFD